MGNTWTEQELRHLCVDTNEDRLPPQDGVGQLRSRAVPATPPAPPPRSMSVPIDDQQHSQITSKPTPMPCNSLGQNSAGPDTTDVKSIVNRLMFASDQLKQRYQLTDDFWDTTTPEAVSSPPSTENEYTMPQQNYTREVNNDEMS